MKDDLPFLDSLNPEQLQNLSRLITKAQEIGVDPRLAAAMAYAESSLLQNEMVKKGDKETPTVKRGSAGELGIMQIKPSTAKLMGYDEKQLMDADANMEAGLKYLKRNIERYKDPVAAALAYNMGPDHPFFSGKGDPSKDGLDYVNKIQSNGGFIPTPTVSAPSAPGTPGGDGKVEVSDEDFRSLQAAGLGAGVGAGIGAFQNAAKALSDKKAPVATPAAPEGGTPGSKWASKVTGHVRPGVETVTEAAQSYQRAKGQGPVSSQISKRFGPPPPGQPGVFTGGRLANPAPLPPAAPLPTFGEAFTKGARTLGGVLNRMPVVSGALAGAGTGFSAEEASKRYQAGDKVGAAIAGAGALGGAASMVPTIPTRILGGGLAMASPVALSVLDRMRKATPEQSQRMLTNVDPMGNPLP